MELKSKSPEALKNLEPRSQRILAARYENKVISAFTIEYFEDIQFKKLIHAWCALCGIRDLPDVANLVLIADFLMNEVGGLTFQEFEVAFKMNMLGEFGDTIEHYNMLNVSFLAKIVLAYKKHRLKADKAYQEIKHKLSLPAQPQLTPFQEDYQTAEAIFKDICRYQQGHDIWGLAYKFDFLERVGIIEVSDDHKRIVFEGMDQKVRITLGAKQARLNPQQFEALKIVYAKECIALQWIDALVKNVMGLCTSENTLLAAVYAHHSISTPVILPTPSAPRYRNQQDATMQTTINGKTWQTHYTPENETPDGFPPPDKPASNQQDRHNTA